jgi:hypothetical protein
VPFTLIGLALAIFLGKVPDILRSAGRPPE